MLSRKQLVAAVWQRLVMGGFSLTIVKDEISDQSPGGLFDVQ